MSLSPGTCLSSPCGIAPCRDPHVPTAGLHSTRVAPWADNMAVLQGAAHICCLSPGLLTGAPQAQSRGGSLSPLMPRTVQSKGWSHRSTRMSLFPAHGPATLVYSSKGEHGMTLKFIG